MMIRIDCATRFFRVMGLAMAASMAMMTGTHAAEVKVKLSGAEEVPAVQTDATGTATFNIAEDGAVTGRVETTGVEGIAAHIHLAPAGQNGPPLVTLEKGDNGVWHVPAGAKLNAEQYASFKAGHLYVNVHSAAHKPGEIRGQLKP